MRFNTQISRKSFIVSKQKMNQEIKRLKDTASIDDARHLLYQIYIREFGWQTKPDCPTGFYVKVDKNGRGLLCDVFDEDAAWFGAYSNNQLIGVARAVHRRNKTGKLDLELYNSCQLPTLTNILSAETNPNLIEVQRGAVAKGHRGGAVIYKIFTSIFSYAHRRNLNVVCTTVFPTLMTFFDKTGLKLIEKNFTYGEDKDETPAHIYYCHFQRLDNAISMMKAASRKRKIHFDDENVPSKLKKFLIV